MKMMIFKSTVVISLMLLLAFGLNAQVQSTDRFLVYEVNLQSQTLKMIWKGEQTSAIGNFQNLKTYLAERDEKLLFAMNGGMFRKDQSAQGLYIENGKQFHRINMVQEAYGNFYMQPNGIFYITKNLQGVVVQTKDFKKTENIAYATQSGPMLLIEGTFHPAFNDGSANLNIRNGVGVLPNGNVLFVMSKEPVNFFDFATFFHEQGCKNALYLDGSVSKTYLPSQNWEQVQGIFGVMIYETE
jgi:uncharacterized protein YigE (DUF2233 family)